MLREALPESIIPTHYLVDLTPCFSDPFVYKGKVEIQLSIISRCNSITLNCKEITIQSAQINSLVATNISYSDDLGRATFLFPTDVNPGSMLLSISFTALHNDKMVGFYRSAFSNKHLLVSQFEPCDCRRAYLLF